MSFAKLAAFDLPSKMVELHKVETYSRSLHPTSGCIFSSLLKGTDKGNLLMIRSFLRQ